MIETYKIIKGIYDQESASFLKMWSDIAQKEYREGAWHEIISLKIN